MIIFKLNLLDVPLLLVFNLDRVKDKGVHVRVVIVLVHLVVLAALRRADSILGHSSENDVHKFDIEGAHKETKQRAVHRRAITTIFLVYLSKELPH